MDLFNKAGKNSTKSEERQLAKLTSPSKELVDKSKKFEKTLKENSKKADADERESIKLKSENKKLIDYLDLLAEKTKDPEESFKLKTKAQLLKNETILMEQSRSAEKSSKESLSLKLAGIIENDPVKKLKNFGSTTKDFLLDTAQQTGFYYSITKTIFQLFSDKIWTWRKKHDPAKYKNNSGVLGNIQYYLAKMGWKVSGMLLNIFDIKDPTNPNKVGNIDEDGGDDIEDNSGITKKYTEGYSETGYSNETNFVSSKTFDEIKSLDDLRSQLVDFYKTHKIGSILYKIIQANGDNPNKYANLISCTMTYVDLASIPGIIRVDTYTKKVKIIGNLSGLTKEEKQNFFIWLDGLIKYQNRLNVLNNKIDDTAIYNNIAKDLNISEDVNTLRDKARKGNDEAIVAKNKLDQIEKAFMEKAVSAEAVEAYSKVAKGEQLTDSEKELAYTSIALKARSSVKGVNFNASSSRYLNNNSPTLSIIAEGANQNFKFGDNVAIINKINSNSPIKADNITKKSEPISKNSYGDKTELSETIKDNDTKKEVKNNLTKQTSNVNSKDTKTGGKITTKIGLKTEKSSNTIVDSIPKEPEVATDSSKFEGVAEILNK